MLGLIVVGLIVVPRLSALAVICVEFGRDTYFKHGVRLTGHKGFRMTDGRSLSMFCGTLFWLFQFAGLALWLVMSHLIAVAVNERIRNCRQNLPKEL